MHEEALLRDLVHRVDQAAVEAGADRVRRVRVWVGALSHVGEGWLRREWPRGTEGTRASGSRLEVEVSTEVGSPRAQALVLVSVEVEGPGAPEATVRTRPDAPG